MADVAEPPASAYVELQLFMPSAAYGFTKAPVVDAETGRPSYSETTESGTPYENTLVGVSDMDIFIFDMAGTYLGKVRDFSYVPVPGNPTYSYVTGQMPQSTFGKSVRLVLMANYAGRGVTLIEPGASSYKTWLPVNQFAYDNVWLPTDELQHKYIPMSGEYHFSSSITAGQKYYGSISMQRAVAKVRVKAGDNVSITAIQVNGLQKRGFALPQGQIAALQGVTPQSVTVPLDAPLTKGTSAYFYLPEQPARTTTLKLTFGDGTQHDVEFKNYRAEVTDPNTDHTYPIVRNYLYDYIISAKAGSDVDIRGNVLDWQWYDITTDVE